MKVFALADPHLALATPNKSMDRFGEHWVDHADKIKTSCEAVVGPSDLLLIAGDLSWAMKMDQAQPDLDFLAALPGRKVIIRGNHDYWWQGIGKVRAALPPDMFALHGDALDLDGIHLCGTRLWDVPGVTFTDWINWIPESEGGISHPPKSADELAQAEKIYIRERGRLDRALAALQALPGVPKKRVAMIHYPPCSPDLSPTEITERIEAAGIDHVVFGHVHSLRTDRSDPFFGARDGVHYHMTACDYLDFKPVLIDQIG